MTVAETPPRPAAVFDLDGSRPRSTDAITLDGPADAHSRIDVWRRRIRFRRHLKRLLLLEERLLEDIGLTGQEAEREVAKPFWRI